MHRPIPRDPEVRKLIQLARHTTLSRRTLLAGLGGSAIALGVAGCAPRDLKPAEDISAADPRVNWSNWVFYIDQDDEANSPTLRAFEEQFGITVNYVEDYDDNNTYFAKVRDQLLLGQDIGADIVTPTEWMAARWAQMGFVQELNEANIPRKANLIDTLAQPDWDPGRRKSLPWQGGFAGLFYNTEATDEVKSVEDLWRPELKDRVVVLSEMRETMGILMMANGVDISGDWSADEFFEALEFLESQLESHNVRVQANPAEAMVKGDVLAGMAWSGDLVQLNFEAGFEKWKFVFPDSGATLWHDTMVVPIGSPRKTNAEKLMNYYYDPAVAAEVAAWVNYVTPVKGAYEEAIKIDAELAENQLIFPNAETLAKTSSFRTLSPDEETEFQAAFQKLLVGAV